MQTKLKPLRDYILIKPFKRRDSDIIFVINNKRMYRGEVIAIGKGRYERPEKDMNARALDVKIGDIVNVGETPLKFPIWHENNETFWIIQESDIGFIETADFNDILQMQDWSVNHAS